MNSGIKLLLKAGKRMGMKIWILCPSSQGQLFEGVLSKSDEVAHKWKMAGGVLSGCGGELRRCRMELK